uniref:Uncharacterized protein n=1 Tax=Naja naja TaxID=35670 RepID=A0A8C6XCA3_NAJNA
MSLQALNGENAETTGRTSILRLSQKENVPPKGIVKPMKVRNFPNTQRDPQTRRILSPDRKKKVEISRVAEITGQSSLAYMHCNVSNHFSNMCLDICLALKSGKRVYFSKSMPFPCSLEARKRSFPVEIGTFIPWKPRQINRDLC